MSLTKPQWAALEALVHLTDRPQRRHVPHPRDVAKVMWPDSPAWEKRTRGRRTGTANGAVGGTMPMNAAKLLWRLRERGLVVEDGENGWSPTERGRGVLAGTAEPRPVPPKVKAPPIVRERKPLRNVGAPA